MNLTTHSKRLAILAVVAGALSALVPVAQAGSGQFRSPDAIDRYVEAQQAKTFATIVQAGHVRSPDAIDRYLEAQRAKIFATIDAQEHASPSVRFASMDESSPDAFWPVSRYEAKVLSPNSTSDVSGRTVAVGSTPTETQPTPANGFDWSDFGIGAGAGIGLMLLLIGLGVGRLVLRHDGERMKTA